jgi:hypothetical protein
MRIIGAAIALSCLIDCAAAQPQPPAAEGSLPYSACADMAALRPNLTGTPDPSPKGDAVLRRLGVRCVGVRAPQARAPY